MRGVRTDVRVALLALLGCACVTPMTFMTNGVAAKRGDFEVSAHVAAQAGAPIVEGAIRHGVTDWLEVGLRGGSIGAHLDVRLQVLRNERARTGIMAFLSVGAISTASCIGCSGAGNGVLRAAVLVSAGVDDRFRFVLGPQLIAGPDPKYAVPDHGVWLSAGGTIAVAFRLWRELWVIPELGLVKTIDFKTFTPLVPQFGLASTFGW